MPKLLAGGVSQVVASCSDGRVWVFGERSGLVFLERQDSGDAPQRQIWILSLSLFHPKKKRRSKNFRVTTPKSGTTCICWNKGWLQQIFAQETLSASWRSFAIFGVDVNWIPSPSKQFLECLDINDVSGGWLWKSSLYILQYHNGWGIIPKEFINMSISILFFNTCQIIFEQLWYFSNRVGFKH